MELNSKVKSPDMKIKKEGINGLISVVNYMW